MLMALGKGNMKIRKRMAGQTRRKSGQPPKVQVKQASAGKRVAVSAHWKPPS